MDAKTGANIKTGKFTLGDKEASFPIFEGTIGPAVVYIGKFYAETGMFTYDPGYTLTGSCEFEDHLYRRRRRHSAVPRLSDRAACRARRFFGDMLSPAVWRASDRCAEGRFRRSCHPAYHGARANEPILSGVSARCAPHGGNDRLCWRAIGVLSRLDGHFGPYPADDCIDSHDSEDADHGCNGVQIFHRSTFHLSQELLDYATNFLRMCFAVPCEDYKPNAVLARAMDRIFILHADHEQNASTSTVRLAGSSGANPFACIAAGCACLWGPAHGGANEAALNMLREIGKPERIPEFVRRAKDPKDSFRLMGFGHRVSSTTTPARRSCSRPVMRC